MSKKPTELIRCTLCRKDKKYLPPYVGGSEIHPADQVCNDCKRLWEIGRQTEKAGKADGKLAFAQVLIDVPLDGRHGDPKTEPVVRGVDIMAAMGATKLQGTSEGGRFSGEPTDIHIVPFKERYAYHPAGKKRVQVPRERAEAMARILTAFLNALAKVRVAGFNDGRDLLAGLAKGDVRIEDYDEQVNNARVGKMPRSRF